MKVPIYQENGLYYIGNEVFAAGICSLLFNSDKTKVEIRIAKDRSEVVDMQNITDYTTKDGVDYADVNEFLDATSGLFSSVNSNVQYPMAVDGDSIYPKDLDIARSNLYGFDGEITDLVSGLHSLNKDLSSTNPKKILLHFNRSIFLTFIGIGNSEEGNFSNVKVIGLTSGGVEKVLIDDSSDNEKRTTFQRGIQGVGVNAVRVEFHTADAVGVTNIAIPKTMFTTLSPNVVFGDNNLSTLLKNGASGSMDIDGSVTPVDFEYEVPANKTLKLQRSFLAIKDGLTDFTSTNFGAISGGLTNGIQIILVHDGIENVLATWKTNFDISLTMYDFFNPYKDGSYVGRWTFSKDTGEPFTLEAGDKIIARINDDLTGLDLMEMSIKGRI